MEEQSVKAVEEAVEKAVWYKASGMTRFAIELIRNNPGDAIAIITALAKVMEASTSASK